MMIATAVAVVVLTCNLVLLCLICREHRHQIKILKTSLSESRIACDVHLAEVELLVERIREQL